jgi:hypothetical protein
LLSSLNSFYIGFVTGTLLVAVARSADIEASDHVSTMKDNIALMNQVYKNFYAISDSDLLKRKL